MNEQMNWLDELSETVVHDNGNLRDGLRFIIRSERRARWPDGTIGGWHALQFDAGEVWDPEDDRALILMPVVEAEKRIARARELLPPQARARRGDPETSHAAARSVRNLTESQRSVRDVLARYEHGLTDEELVNAYPHYQSPPVPRLSASGIRTRRSELVRRGEVADSDKRRPTKSGRQAIVWEVVR